MEPPRKKLRRLVNSCLECRRRKIRCDLSSHGSETCTACAARDVHCERWRESDTVPDSNSLELGTRLRRVEHLLQRLTDVDSSTSGTLLNDGTVDGSVTAPIETDSRPPLLSLFDNAVFGQQEDPLPSEGASSGKSSCGVRDVNQEKLRLILGTLLPSQEDANLIIDSTNAWGLGRLLYSTESQANHQLDIAAIAEGPPLTIAGALMQFACLIQQLPPEFDATTLNLNSPIQTVLQKYLHYVTDLVTSKDDFACTMPGLECLLLQTLFYINDGNLRRAWLAGRRCLYVAQFMGLQKSYLKYFRREIGAENEEKARAMMWMRTVLVDRYLAPILGMPCGVGEDCFGDDHSMRPFEGLLDVFERRLCVIAGLIATRNQRDPSPGYNATLDIDEELEKVTKEMGDTLTVIPTLSTVHRSIEEDDGFKLVLNQMWFYTLCLFLHIPWMLRAFTDHKFEYSRFACLQASREQLKRYLALRSTNNTQGTARVVDFATTIASATLILNQVGSAANPTSAKHEDDDEPLVSKVVESMRIVARGPREFMARQGVQVIETLLALKNSDPSATTTTRIRLTIPYFGPISIQRRSNPDSIGGRDAVHRLTENNRLLNGSVTTNNASNNASFEIATGHAPDYGHDLSFEYTDISEPGWLPPLDAWDFDNVPDWGDTFGLWDVSNWNS